MSYVEFAVLFKLHNEWHINDFKQWTLKDV